MTTENEIENLSEEEAKDMLLSMVEDTYTLISWPESQDYMEKEWFEEEAFLAPSEAGDSSYFIPTKYLI